MSRARAPWTAALVCMAMIAALIGFAGTAPGAAASGGSLDRMEAPDGSPSDATVYLTDLSMDGSQVLAHSTSGNLAVSTGAPNVLRWNRSTNTVGRITTMAPSGQFDGGCFGGSSTVAGGQVFVVCEEPGIIPGEPTTSRQAFSIANGGTEVVSLNDDGIQANFGVDDVDATEAASLVAFTSASTNLAAGGDGCTPSCTDDVFLRDIGDEETIRVSSTPDGDAGNGDSDLVEIAESSGAVLFYSDATDLQADGRPGLYVYDNGVLRYVAVANDGTKADAGTGREGGISRGGRYVVFDSFSNNLVPGDTGGRHVFLRDLLEGTTEMVSVTPEGDPADGQSYDADVSDDGRYVTFISSADDLGPGATSNSQVYRRDMVTGTTIRISETPTGQPANDFNRNPVINADGSVIAFESSGDNLLPGDEQDVTQLLVWESDDAPPACNFSDVGTGHDFRTEICWAVAQGITTGYADGTFRPTAVVTRQALVTFLWRMQGADPGPFPATGLSDVPTSEPFRTAIGWAVDEGVVAGYADGTFKPTAAVSRQAMLVFLWRLSGSPTAGFPTAGFSDLPGGDFGTAISWAVDREITNGYDDGTFRPTAPVSRQAGVAFLYRWDALPS